VTRAPRHGDRRRAEPFGVGAGGPCPVALARYGRSTTLPRGDAAPARRPPRLGHRHAGRSAGQQLANSNQPYGAALPTVVDPESLERVVLTRRPAIGAPHPRPHPVLAVPVRVRCCASARCAYVLTAALRPEAFLEVLNRQRIPPDWVVSVFDAHNMRVARSRQHAEYLNKPPAPGLEKLMQRGDEGPARVRARRRRGLHLVQPLARDGWTVADRHPARRGRSRRERARCWSTAAASYSRSRSACSRRLPSPAASPRRWPG
jgi:hypothetical protein